MNEFWKLNRFRFLQKFMVGINYVILNLLRGLITTDFALNFNLYST